MPPISAETPTAAQANFRLIIILLGDAVLVVQIELHGAGADRATAGSLVGELSRHVQKHPNNENSRSRLTDFGSQLRSLRSAAGWRQADLVEQLGGSFARSTVAKLETGREMPSERFWRCLETALPEWASQLEPHLPRPGSARKPKTGPPATVLGGPFVVEMLRLVYVFRASRSPEEIIEVRRVRASASGADSYGLKLAHTGREGFRLDEEVLWGGDLEDATHHDGNGTTVYLRRLWFGRSLRRGQSHEFALRSWIARDPEPCTEIQVTMTIPSEFIALDVHFLGPATPMDCWRFGPLADETLVPARPADTNAVPISHMGRASTQVTSPQPGAIYGLRWRW